MDDWHRWDGSHCWRGTIRRIPSLCTLALALCMALGLAPTALAAPAAPTQARAALSPAAAAASGHVTVIVLDMSGSMAQNDPQGLRCSAAGAYIDLRDRKSTRLNSSHPSISYAVFCLKKKKKKKK